MISLAVSILIPTYNRAHLLPRALESVLSQTGPNDEILVADDASTDNTPEVMAQYKGRVHYHRLPHGGAGVTRNRAISLATKPLVAFLDSDDLWMPGKLELQRTVLTARPDVLFCFSDFAVRKPDGAEIHHYLERWHRDPRPWAQILGPALRYSMLAPLPSGYNDFEVHVGSIYLAEMERDYVSTSCLMVRREAAGEALHFAEDLPVSEDKECMARLAGRGLAAYLDVETMWNCGHAGPRLTDIDALSLIDARLTLLKRIWACDKSFVTAYGDKLREAVRTQYLKRARLHIARGRMAEARADLRKVPRCPLPLQLLAAMPETMVRNGLALRRWLRSSRNPTL